MNSMSSSESLNKITSSLSVSSAVTSSFASSPFAFAFDSLSEKTFKKLYDQLKTCANFTFFELHWRHDNINCCKGIMLIRVRTLFCSEMRQANSCSRGDSHQSWGREKQFVTIPIWDKQLELWKSRNQANHYQNQTFLAILSRQLIQSFYSKSKIWMKRN